MIDIRKLKELVRLMVENDLSELDLKDQEETVTIKRGAGAIPMVQPMIAQGAVAPRPPAGWTGEEPPTGTPNGTAAPAPDETGLAIVESPMVGTFYSSPNPDAGPFVQVGATIGPETVVCLIEAMKVFNEIKAECSGVVEKVLVSSGEAVEFGQKLFLVRPA